VSLIQASLSIEMLVCVSKESFNFNIILGMMIYKDLRQLKFVTSNADKVREATDIMGFSLDQISSLKIDEVQSDDISKVVIHKAKQSYDIVKLPVLVEDSGLVFKAWNGLPGPFIKWFETSVGCQGLLKMIEGFENRQALAVCFVAIFDGKEIIIGKGEVRGEIASSIHGENGFGWDVIFVPEGHKKTFAEMASNEKNLISHRRLAFEDLKKKIT
jgi:non-canonical purine NTP pyrophosphatase (RdgB/HAM1 family)